LIKKTVVGDKKLKGQRPSLEIRYRASQVTEDAGYQGSGEQNQHNDKDNPAAAPLLSPLFPLFPLCEVYLYLLQTTLPSGRGEAAAVPERPVAALSCPA